MNKKLYVFMVLFGLAVAGTVRFDSSRCGFGNASDEDCTFGYDDWVKMQRSAPSDMHTIVFAVAKPANAAAQCDSALMRVSHPDSPDYGKYYTLESMRTLGLFSEQSTREVERFLRTNGFRDFITTVNGDWIKVSGPVNKLEKLINAEFYDFYSDTAGKTIKRTASFALPQYLVKHIDFIGNTIFFPPVKMDIAMVSSGNNGVVTPAFLNTFYGINSNMVTNAGATQSVFEALGQDYSPSDLTQFQQTFNTFQQGIAQVIGSNDPSQCSVNPNNCVEANLDVQYIMGLAQNASTTFWSIDASSQDPFLDWVVALSNDNTPPLVHSMSYGSIAQENPSVDVYRFNTDVCQLGLRGLTVVISSGDDGVANFIARNNASACGFNPSFPTTSPYVTGVGATQGPESGQPEIACSSNTNGIITSGGGFSVFFPRPSYQDSVVQNYLTNGPNVPPQTMFNVHGRAYPDVAMMGFNYEMVDGGSVYNVSGTSASAPVFAALVTLVNNARLNAGHPAVGFLNPTIYTLGVDSGNGIFNDITSGENNCCAGYPGQFICCQYGFTATTGWDPLTGFGSVNFQPFLKAFMNTVARKLNL